MGIAIPLVQAVPCPAEPGYFRSYWRTTGAQLAHEARCRNVSAASRATVARPMKGTLNQKKAIKLLKENGWTQARGGKHQVKMTKPGYRPITLPQHKGRDYPTGLAQAILKQAELR
jgi:predicted RNA binding protein YcfA (HicA-like mRNA interferase family)